jgi:hypothetical protein
LFLKKKFNLLSQFAKSPSADIRKAVIFCLVEAHFILGEDFFPFLAQLSSTQSKLVQIYYLRKLKANEHNGEKLEV